jgi:hypothetical protein
MMVQHHRGGSATPKHIETSNASLFCSHPASPQGKTEKGRNHFIVVTLEERCSDRDNGQRGATWRLFRKPGLMRDDQGRSGQRGSLKAEPIPQDVNRRLDGWSLTDEN